MILSFIGMSGSGKSHWSKKLQEKGFKRFCCDDLIEEKLRDEFKRIGFSGIQDVAKWMGQPFDPQHKRSSKKYLQFENEVLKEILDQIENNVHKDVVIDTTGSVIYTGKDRLERLIQQTKIIYFDTPDSVKTTMYKLYLKDPKPVIWGRKFKISKDESQMEALANCYPQLLAYRSKKYQNLAHKTLAYRILRDKNFSTEMLLEVIL
jgi:shikimate kinase